MSSFNLHHCRCGSWLKKAVVVMAFAVVVSWLPLGAAFADNDDKRDRQHQDQGRHEQESRGRHHRYPVHVPPPVYRPRYESPGIRLVIPIDIR